LNFEWLAGVVDAKATFAIRKQMRWTKTMGLRPRYYPELIIADSNKALIERANQISPGRIIRRQIKPGKYKTQWVIVWSTNKLRELLPKLYQYLLKKQQASIFIDILNKLAAKKLDNAREGGGRVPYSNEDLVWFEEQREKLRRLM
jgi:hypothetical protein